MPPLQLAHLLHSSLPHVSVKGRALLSALACVNGRPTSSTEFAQWFGFHDRYQLARALKREGLPPIETLGGWTRTLYWILESQASGATLRELALREHLDPAVAYKLIRRVTGRRWSEIRQEGLTGAVLSFQDHCSSPAQRRHHRRLLQPDATRRPPFSGDLVPATIEGARVPMPGAPCAVARSGASDIYIALGHAAALGRLDVSTRRVPEMIAVGCVPSCIAIDSPRSCAYVSVQFEGTVTVVDLPSQTVSARIPVPGDPFPLQLSRNGQVLYTATNADCLHALSLPTGQITASLALPAPSHFLALHPTGYSLYVAARESGTVLEIDTAQFRITRTFRLGGVCQEMALTADGRFLYVANEHHGLDVIRLADGRVARVAHVKGRAVHLTLSADERTIYVALYEGGAVAAVDRDSGSVRLMPTGGRPRSMVMALDGTLVVSNEAGWVDLLPTTSGPA